MPSVTIGATSSENLGSVTAAGKLRKGLILSLASGGDAVFGFDSAVTTGDGIDLVAGTPFVVPPEMVWNHGSGRAIYLYSTGGATVKYVEVD